MNRNTQSSADASLGSSCIQYFGMWFTTPTASGKHFCLFMQVFEKMLIRANRNVNLNEQSASTERFVENNRKVAS